MTEEEKEILVKTWIEAQQADEKIEEYKSKFWAIETLIDLPYDNPETTWDLILEIHERDDSKKIESILAAGPLEDLMTEHGPEFINRVELKARREPKFRRLLGGVWLSSRDTLIQKRFYAAANIKPPFTS